MKVSNRISKLLPEFIIPFSLSVLLGILFYFAFFKQLFPEYNYAKSFKQTSKFILYANDLNEDGESEIIFAQNEILNSGQSNFSISIPPINALKTFSQTNFSFNLVNENPLMFLDYDNDHKKEIFVFFVDDSLLFLVGFKLDIDAGIEPRQFCKIIIDTVKVFKNGFQDFNLFHDKCFDINHDGFKELIFSINGKYSAYPRRIYIFDIKNHILKASGSYYRIPVSGLNCVKSNYDSGFYYFPNGIGSFSNVADTNIRYHDRRAWIFAFNKNLKPAFEPIPLGKEGFSRTNFQCYFSHNGTEGIISQFIDLNKKTTFRLVDFNGNILKQKSYNKLFLDIKVPYDTVNYSCCTVDGQNLLFLDYELNIAKKIKLSGNKNSITSFSTLNIDKDAPMEYIFVSNFDKEMLVYDDNLEFMFSLPNLSSRSMLPYHISSKVPENYIGYRSGLDNVIFYFIKNKYFYLTYLFSFLVVVISYFIFQLFIKQRVRAIENKHQQEKDLIEAQLKIANKQMSPHFQFNVLNAISYLFESDKDKAQYYLGKYSRLISQVMMNVDKIETTLNNEIEFTNNFLILEQLRLNNKFDFSIEIDENVNRSLLIPRMSIFTFCENAVKHGLFHLDKKGKLEVNVKKSDKNRILVTIDDNGIGRNESNKISTHGAGMGLRILNEIFFYFEKYGGIKIEFEFIDKIQGTRVELFIE